LEAKKSIFTLQFWMLCCSSFLFFSSFNMLIPELPDYLSSMGGAEYKGLIIALFTLTAGLSRPFSGKLTDHIGRVSVMAVGSIVCCICGFLYPICTTVFPFLLLRFFHGFSTGFKPTGTAAYIADVVPADRRGESMGIHGLVGGLGMAFGPALGGWIGQYFPINILFYTSSLLSFLSIAIIFNIKETLPKSQKEKFQLSHLKINKADIFDKTVLPVVIVILFTSFTYGVIVTLIQDYSKLLGIKNKGYFFVVYTLASILIRIIAGKWSDKVGRAKVLKYGCWVLIGSLLILAAAQNIYMLTFSAILYGLSMGIISPICQAWTIDLCAKENIGKAVATMYIALEFGIGLGALFPTLYYQNDPSRLPLTFVFTALMAVVALGYLFYYERKSSVLVG
jgi:MFS family permease